MRGELKPVQKRTLTQEAFDQLVSYIQDGTLNPGDALPSQQELARQLSVSRPVLREAMQRLEAAGLIEIRHGSGTYVAQPPVESLLDSIFKNYNYEKALEVLEVRLILEAEMAGLAAVRATEEDIDRMQQAVDKIRHLNSDGDLTVEGADDFHRALGQASHNTVLSSIAKILYLPNYIQGIRVELALPDISAHEHESHLRLLDAVRSGDSELARETAREHLERSHGSSRQAAELRRRISENGQELA